jgi:hypothetical protein
MPVAPVTTATSWDQTPFDNQLMILQYAHEHYLANRDRFRARVLAFRFSGFIAQADRQALWQGVEDWQLQWRLYADSNNGLNVDDWPPEPEQLQAVERHLETCLRAVFDALFSPDTEDELNLTEIAWTQIVFRIQAVLPEFESANGFRPAEIRATSADGLHRIRLIVCRLPEAGPYTCVNIRYYGPQRFRTFDTREGALHEFRAPQLRHVHGLDEPRVFENWV